MPGSMSPREEMGRYGKMGYHGISAGFSWGSVHVLNIFWAMECEYWNFCAGVGIFVQTILKTQQKVFETTATIFPSVFAIFSRKRNGSDFVFSFVEFFTFHFCIFLPGSEFEAPCGTPGQQPGD